MWNSPRALNAAAATITLVVLVVSLGVAVHWLTHRPMFVLRIMRVDAEAGSLHHVNAATVRAIALPAVHGNFFTVNLATVRQAFETISWVRHARVRREWPNRLVVKIEEHEVLGIWNQDRLLNTFGEVFTANLAETEGGLPLFYGPDAGAADVRQRYGDLSAWFAEVGLKPIELALSARYAWTVRCDNGSASGLIVELGREVDGNTLRERVARLLAAYPEVHARWPHVAVLDLRYPNGFALRDEVREERPRSDSAPAPEAAPATQSPATHSTRRPRPAATRAALNPWSQTA